jgi:hypothetical protein
MDELLSIAVVFIFGFVLLVLFLLIGAAFFTINH